MDMSDESQKQIQSTYTPEDQYRAAGCRQIRLAPVHEHRGVYEHITPGHFWKSQPGCREDRRGPAHGPTPVVVMRAELQGSRSVFRSHVNQRHDDSPSATGIVGVPVLRQRARARVQQLRHAELYVCMHA